MYRRIAGLLSAVFLFAAAAFASPTFYDVYAPVIRDGLVAAYDPATLHGTLSDGSPVSATLPDISGNGNDILPSALPVTGLPTYKELDPTTGTGRGPAFAPRVHLYSKNTLVTPAAVRAAIGSGDVTIITIATVPAYGAGNWGLWGFANGSAYRSGTGSINSSGSINVFSTFESGFLKLKRATTQIGDFSIDAPATAKQISFYRAIIAKRVSGVWYVSRDALPFQPVYSANSTDAPGASPLLDVCFGWFGNSAYPANEDLLYAAVYNRALSDFDVDTEVYNFSVSRLDCANIVFSGNSILYGYNLASEDKPATYINALYNESGTASPAFYVLIDAVVGRKYQDMPRSYWQNSNGYGNLMSPLRGPTIVVIEEETNSLTANLATFGNTPAAIAATNANRELFVKQFYGLRHCKVFLSSMKPRLSIPETARAALYADLVSYIASCNALYGDRFRLLDSGSDSAIGIAGAQNGPLYLSDHTHLSGTDSGGERILIVYYYLTTLAGWTAEF
jgi:hypothetical protein